MGKKPKKTRKVRVEFRKNREVRARQKLTPEQLDHEQVEDLATEERISGKGELSRYRTVKSLSGDSEDALLRAVDEAECVPARILSTAGLNCLAQTEDGTVYECTVRRVVKMLARESRNAVVTGDRVLIRTLNEEQGVVERVETRTGVLSRQSAGQEHMIVANVDQALIVVSADDPPLKPSLVDRFLISCEKGDVQPIIGINKIDLVDPAALQPIVGMYAELGYETLLLSAAREIGIERLKMLLRGRQTVLSGQSGVGKSSLLNRIHPGLDLDTSTVSDWTRKGKHTTRRAVMYPLSDDGWVVDTPGIRQMALWDVIPEEVEGFFIEFRPFVPLCRFPDCTHTHEDECGIKLAVGAELISPLRYDSYLRILGDDE